MARKSFAFSFDEDATTGKATLAWLSWRYGSQIENPNATAQKDVTAALQLMASNLNKGDEIDDIWVFSHGTSQGGLKCRLRSGDSHGYVTPKAALAFATSSADVQALQPFMQKNTGAHLWACNLAKSPDSLGAWRAVFTAGQGWACGPKAYFHLGFRSTFVRNGYRSRRKGCPSKIVRFAPDTRAELTQLLSEMDSFFDEQAQAAEGQKPCLPAARATRLKHNLRRDVAAVFDKFLLQAFAQLGNERPPAVLNATLPNDRTAIINAMWDLWDSVAGVGFDGGILTPFLCDELLSFKVAGSVASTRKPPNSSTTIYLPDAANWSNAWVSLPRSPRPC